MPLPESRFLISWKHF